MLIRISSRLAVLGVLLLSYPCWAQGSALPETMPPTASRTSYRAIQQQVENNLQQHVLSMWFPRAVNKKQGGFDQNFSENWTNTSKGERSIVYQARLTWLASQTALRYPAKRAQWAGYSKHGADFLKKNMWDAKNGGFFWELDGAKTPNRKGEKHAYGIAFAIYALSANYRATGDKSSLTLAKQAFRWLDKYGHDTKNRGYYEAFTREGKRILAPLSTKESSDVIGTRYGYKSMNAHIHMLEAFSALYQVWPDATLKSRLRELFDLTRDTVVVSPPGAMHLYFSPDWKPIPDHDSYGHDIETAYLLVEAAEVLEMKDDARTWKVARSLVDHTIEFGADSDNGGFYDSGGSFSGVFNAEKIWWVQAEALNALLLMHEKYGAQTPRYWDAFVGQWQFIQRHQIDAKNGGWYSAVTKEGAAMPGRGKSDGWTEGYHQGRALLNVTAMLGRLSR